MLLFPYDACNRSLVEHFNLICAGSNEKKIVSQSSVWPYEMLEQVEAYEKMKRNPKL
jgi:hypothetical protein